MVDTSEEDWDRAFAINLRTAFLASKHAVPVMAEKGARRRSSTSRRSRPCGATAPSPTRRPRAGVSAMTVDMAYSHGRQGIRVNAIAPGHITTPMVHVGLRRPARGPSSSTRMRAEAGLLGTPGTGWDVAWAAVFLASDEARWITGVTLPVDSGVLSVTPLLMAQHLRAVPEPEALG